MLMKKILIIVVTLLIFTTISEAQIGLGAAVGMLNPGLLKSDVSESQFDPGWGYEFFIRHNLAQIGDSLMIKARWSYRHYKSTIELPNVLEIWFKFNSLSIDLFIDLVNSDNFVLYSGLGVSLVSVNAEKDFLKVTETEFVPEILVGGELSLSQNYNLFTEFSFQFGSVENVNNETIPFTGFRIVVGATMFLISE
jgi:hypothetical protein